MLGLGRICRVSSGFVREGRISKTRTNPLANFFIIVTLILPRIVDPVRNLTLTDSVKFRDPGHQLLPLAMLVPRWVYNLILC